MLIDRSINDNNKIEYKTKKADRRVDDIESFIEQQNNGLDIETRVEIN